VKAFNGILWTHLLERGRPHGDPERIALPVAGDDPDQVAKVVGLIDEIGFDAVYAGPLSESWRMHPSTPVYGADADAAGVRRALAAASPERPAEWTAGYGASRCSNSRRAEPLADLP
jgi:predicted dinucleotide-binding enzyme